ncbi:aldehyde ferredoxin oxidoreductase family protein [Halegenticoccus soli]|uniref:aldehyde ferredoxin oxidoreductase family protein n=1 Tax=Halegenticoccus soli TaxID=1985678 RepID=UPI000C6ED776|nr:aldehyde ferredoxin oxidoreductase C-terminal domain-containing protein [Halegenticoccus soli]
MAHRTRDRVLRVDLSDGTVRRERVPQSWRRRFVGGKGLGARYLYRDVPAGADPLGPENVLGFMLGPLSGYLPGESRYAAVTKSPLTGAFLDSYSGGEFPDRLAGALADCLGLLVAGRASDPVAIEVENGTATVEPADCWGEDAVSTDERYPDAAVACVGPAGERTVSYATIASDGGDHHAGRGGAGTVMGAKRLKAVVARGEPPEGLPRLREAYDEAYREHDTGRWQAAGATIESVDFANEVGVLPTRGWQTSQFDGASDIGVEAARAAAMGRERDGAVPGGFRVETDDGESVPRGATPMTLGAGLGIDEFDAVATLGAACDRLGVDVIDAGSAVAWAMRASEDGLVERDLAFGDAAGARDLLEEIAHRRGPLGDALADGVEAAAERFGGGDRIPTVKSMALPAYDPRGAVAMALAYATSDRGGCHRRARPIEREVFAADSWDADDRVTAVVDAQDARSVLWSLVVDDFAGETLREDLGAEWLSAVGLSYDPDDLRTAGERIWTLVRLFNAREGFARDDDRLPQLLREPLADGPAAGRALDPDGFERLLDAYYAARGWSPDGVPARRTVERLGLDGVVDADTPVADTVAVDPTEVASGD